MGEGLYIGFLIVMSLLLIAAIACRSFAGAASVLGIMFCFGILGYLVTVDHVSDQLPKERIVKCYRSYATHDDSQSAGTTYIMGSHSYDDADDNVTVETLHYHGEAPNWKAKVIKYKVTKSAEDKALNSGDPIQIGATKRVNKKVTINIVK